MNKRLKALVNRFRMNNRVSDSGREFEKALTQNAGLSLDISELSSWIKTIKYDRVRGHLIVFDKNSYSFRMKDVSLDEFLTLLGIYNSGESVGSYVNRLKMARRQLRGHRNIWVK